MAEKPSEQTYSLDKIKTDNERLRAFNEIKKDKIDKTTDEGSKQLSLKWMEKAGLSAAGKAEVFAKLGPDINEETPAKDFMEAVRAWQESNGLVDKKTGKGDGILGWKTLEQIDNEITREKNSDEDYNSRGDKTGSGLEEAQKEEQAEKEKVAEALKDTSSPEYIKFIKDNGVLPDSSTIGGFTDPSDGKHITMRKEENGKVVIEKEGQRWVNNKWETREEAIAQAKIDAEKEIQRNALIDAVSKEAQLASEITQLEARKENGKGFEEEDIHEASVDMILAQDELKEKEAGLLKEQVRLRGPLITMNDEINTLEAKVKKLEYKTLTPLTNDSSESEVREYYSSLRELDTLQNKTIPQKQKERNELQVAYLSSSAVKELTTLQNNLATAEGIRNKNVRAIMDKYASQYAKIDTELAELKTQKEEQTQLIASIRKANPEMTVASTN